MNQNQAGQSDMQIPTEKKYYRMSLVFDEQLGLTS